MNGSCEMRDLHAHILPGVDDGAKTLAETLAMCRAAADGGTRTVLATPHRKDVTEESSVSHLRRLIAEANALNAANGVALTLALGMENHLSPDLPDEIAAGRALPMNASRYILIEMPFFGAPSWVEPTLDAVRRMGLTPVLAHPERIEAFQRDADMLARFIERGMLSQITAGSLVGAWGAEVERFTRDLLRRRMAHVMASDTHAAEGRRSPNLTYGVDAAASIVGRAAARRMVTDAPLAILEDRPLAVDAPLRE